MTTDHWLHWLWRELVMTLNPLHRPLAARLLAFFQQGFELSPDVIHYIDSTFFHPSRQELHAILHAESNAELDSLRELLIFPDVSVQLEIESLLAQAPVDITDETRLIETLCEKALETTIRFPDSRGSLKLRVSKDALAQFVQHLNLSQQLDSRIITALSGFDDQALQNEIKIKFRNAKPVCGDKQIGFMCDFLKSSANIQGDLLDHLDFALGLLDEVDEQSDVYQILMARRRFYSSCLRRARAFEEQRQTSNMETMLSQGIRPVHYDVAELSRTIDKIDAVSRAVFGRTEVYDQFEVHENVVDLGRDRDIGKLLRLMS
jgi:hypothetical protein